MREKNNPISLLFFLLAVLAVVAFMSPTWAGDNHNSDSTVDASSIVSNSVSDSSRSFGIGGSDYDIGRGSCVYHVGGLTFAFSVIDEFCQGMDLIRAGMVEAGRLHICTQSKVGNNYATVQECKDDLFVMVVSVDKPVAMPEPDDDDEDYREEIQQTQQVYQENLAELESRVVRMESRRQAKPQVIQQPFLSDAKKAALREVVK